jgi:hypothetical protein
MHIISPLCRPTDSYRAVIYGCALFFSAFVVGLATAPASLTWSATQSTETGRESGYKSRHENKTHGTGVNCGGKDLNDKKACKRATVENISL